ARSVEQRCRLIERLLHVEHDRQGSLDIAGVGARLGRLRDRNRSVEPLANTLQEVLDRYPRRLLSHHHAPRGSTDAPPAAEVQWRMSNVVAELDSSDRAMRRSSPMRERQAPAVVSARRSPTGSAPIARTTVMNSTTSSRRSPPSYFATNDCGRPSRLAKACWVSPAFLRACAINSQKTRYWGVWTDLPMPRARGAIGAAG